MKLLSRTALGVLGAAESLRITATIDRYRDTDYPVALVMARRDRALAQAICERLKYSQVMVRATTIDPHGFTIRLQEEYRTELTIMPTESFLWLKRILTELDGQLEKLNRP